MTPYYYTVYMQILCTFCMLTESRKIRIPYPSHLSMFISAYFKVWMAATFKIFLFSTLLAEMVPTFHFTLALNPGIPYIQNQVSISSPSCQYTSDQGG